MTTPTIQPAGAGETTSPSVALTDLVIDIQAGNYTGSLNCWSHELTVLQAAARIQQYQSAETAALRAACLALLRAHGAPAASEKDAK